jgi:fucose permease
MHACYGVGAASGPLIVTAAVTLDLSWRWAFGTVAAVQGVLAVAFAVTARSWVSGRVPAARRTVRRAVPRAAPLRAALPGVTLFAVHTGLESSASLWAYVYLTEARGVSPPTAALLVSGYWSALLIGRLVLGPVADRTGARPVLLASFGGMVAGAALLFLPGAAAAAGVLVLGVAAAPVWPLLTLTTKDRVGEHHADRVIGLQTAAGSAGSATVPALVGVLIGWSGARVVALCLLILAVVTALTYLSATRIAGRVRESRSS